MDDDAVFEAVEAWLNQGRKVALATLVETWGSAPVPPGSHLAVADDGRFAGSVSGGCAEAAVIAEAQEVLAGRRPSRILTFSVSDRRAWAVGLACGGTMHVYVEPLE